jgi:hypothetical protein
MRRMVIILAWLLVSTPSGVGSLAVDPAVDTALHLAPVRIALILKPWEIGPPFPCHELHRSPLIRAVAESSSRRSVPVQPHTARIPRQRGEKILGRSTTRLHQNRGDLARLAQRRRARRLLPPNPAAECGRPGYPRRCPQRTRSGSLLGRSSGRTVCGTGQLSSGRIECRDKAGGESDADTPPPDTSYIGFGRGGLYPPGADGPDRWRGRQPPTRRAASWPGPEARRWTIGPPR